jgi:dihydropteroate synthase
MVRPVLCEPMFSWQSLCSQRAAVMGILNVTPDSFSDGGRHLDPDAAVEHGLALVADGADLLDVGGESTRPGAEPVDEAEELRRVLPVVSRLAEEAGVPVSVDTSKARVAAAAIDGGAVVVNDVTAGRGEPDILDVVARGGAGYVVMHMLGEPRTMQQAPRYDDVVAEVGSFLVERLAVARQAGIAPGALCADPGVGFGKLVRHNLEVLAHLDDLVARVDVPVMVGVSRKGFLGAVLSAAIPGSEPRPPIERDDATLAAAMWALDRGASVLRVHSVRPVAEAIRFAELMSEVDAEAVA